MRLDRSRFDALLEERGLIDQLDALLAAIRAAARRQGLDLTDLDAVLPVGGSSRIPLLRRWLEQRLPGIPLRGERPVEAVALGALALTPGVQIRDVLSRGVSLRCWDQRSGEHRWHPLYVAGQSWPTETPLELVLACSNDGQREFELVLGEPLPEERSEVIFEAGLPVIRRRNAGAAAVEPWSSPPTVLSLATPGRRGDDRLRLRFGIDAHGTLTMEAEDLTAAGPILTPTPLQLGPVR
jgi:molecular chaperone DnaK (HSP70)